jgi:mitochondrial fission protein ELM1
VRDSTATEAPVVRAAYPENVRRAVSGLAAQGARITRIVQKDETTFEISYRPINETHRLEVTA